MTAALEVAVCVFVAKRLHCVELKLASTTTDFEIVILDILLSKTRYRLSVVYRKPIQGAAGTQAARSLIELLSRHHNNNGPNIIMGDLNCPSVNWTLSDISTSENAESFIHDYFAFNGFTQCVSEPTRGSNFLDVICVDEPLIIRDTHTGPAFSTSDHDTVFFSIDAPSGELDNNNSEREDKTEKKYLWSQADFAAMSDYLCDINWTEMFSTNLTPDDLWTAFSAALDEAIDGNVPSVPVQRRPSAPKRYPRYIRVLFSRKRAVWRQYRNDRSNKILKAKYDKISDDCRAAVKRYEIAKENAIINSNNLGNFYRYVNQKLSCRSGVGSLTNKKGDHVTTDVDKANILNEYFGSVCTTDNGIIPPFNVDLPPGADINTVSFDVPKLISAIRKIKNKNKLSCGPDGYPVRLLTALAPVLVQPMSQMFASFISVGKLPSAWKKAIVTPVFKKGSSSDPGNYRPISQTSIFCKLFERTVAAEITQYLFKHKLLSPQQHGFLAKRSTLTNLLETTNDWSITIDNKHLQKAVYIDFSKAFDTVSHSKLLIKLRSYGITGDLLSVIEDFLSGRSQRTRVGNDLSDTVLLTSGVVQGSCLGPLLFLLFINDITKIFGQQITTKLYADDLKLYTVIDSQHDIEQLQHCLDSLCAWSDTWQLTISIKKCQTLNIGSHASCCNACKSHFRLGSEIIPDVDSVVDLGITITSQNKFSMHVSKIVRKASTRCYLIRKCFLSKDTETLVRAFKTYVRPLLEYNSSVWSPYLLKDIDLLENVQRRFTKYLKGLYNLSYHERMHVLGLETLEIRRIRYDIITAYKIIFGLTIINSSDMFNFAFASSINSVSTRGHKYKLLPPICHCDTRRHCFASRVVFIWNNLPPETTDFSSLVKFKNCIPHSFLTKYCVRKY